MEVPYIPPRSKREQELIPVPHIKGPHRMDRSPKQAPAASSRRGLDKVGFGPIRMFAED